MNRQSLIKALYGPIAPGLKPLNNPEYEMGTDATGKFAYFNKYNSTRRRRCDPQEARLHRRSFVSERRQPEHLDVRWSEDHFPIRHTTRASRVTSSQIFQQQLMAIGIKLD